MPTSIKDIRANIVEEADISATAFDENSAGYLADVLKDNTQLKKLNFELTNIDDADFTIIAGALRQRSVSLQVLNIDQTDITVASLPTIKSLLSEQKVRTLLMYGLDGIHDDQSVIDELKKIARDTETKISIKHPHERKSYPGFFEKTQTETHKFPDELKDPTPNLDCRPGIK